MSGREEILSSGSGVARLILLVVCAWLLFCAIAIFELGLWPRTTVGWALALGFGPIAYFAVALAVELGLRMVERVPWVRRSRDWVERRTYRKRFSWLRVGYMFMGCLFLFLVALALWVHDESRPHHESGALGQFIARHFR